MNFIQKHTIQESSFGSQTVWFAVSDNYSELFNTTGNETSIFLLDTVKQDLNIEETKFAIDELSFSINELACSNDIDKNCLAFTLESKNQLRICSVFMIKNDEVPNNDNMLFIGRIDNKISGDDKLWSSTDFGTQINPLREYKFSALSLDISLLEECKYNEKVYNEESVNIPNIYERIAWADISSINNPTNFSYALDVDDDYDNVALMNVSNMLKLSDAIELMLNKSNELIQAKYGLQVKFNLLSSDLGFQVSPMKYDTRWQYLQYEKDVTICGLIIDNSNLYQLKLKPSDYTNTAEPWINWKMINPQYGLTVYDATDYSEAAINVRNQISEEEQFSFKHFSNVAELLFAIAKSLNCYIKTSYSIDNEGILNCNFEYISRLNLVESNNTFIIGANDANIDTSSAISEDTNKFYAQPNIYAVEDYNEEIQSPNRFTLNATKKVELYQKDRENEEKKYKTKFERILFSTSSTLVKVADYTHAWNIITDTIAIGLPLTVKETLTNALYIKIPVPESRQQAIITRESLNITECIRPIAKVYAKLDNEILSDNLGDGILLGDYINRAFGHDKQYYETEYSLTIPYWNGFSKSQYGTNPSWKNLKLGTKIELKENVRIYQNGNWVTFNPAIGTEFTVVSIERKVDLPETKIKLHNIGRFAYNSYFEGKEGEVLQSSGTSIKISSTPAVDDKDCGYFTINSNSTIQADDAVSLLSDRTIAKSEATAGFVDCIGIALNDGLPGELIKVQRAGLVRSDKYNFTTITGTVQVITNPTGCNVSQDLDEESLETGDAIIDLGRAESNNSFYLNICGMAIG